MDELIAADKITEVAQYCESDILNTYRLWLIYEEFRGALTKEELHWSELQLQSYVRQHKMQNAHLLAAVNLIETDANFPSNLGASGSPSPPQPEVPSRNSQ